MEWVSQLLDNHLSLVPPKEFLEQVDKLRGADKELTADVVREWGDVVWLRILELGAGVQDEVGHA